MAIVTVRYRALPSARCVCSSSCWDAVAGLLGDPNLDPRILHLLADASPFATNKSPATRADQAKVFQTKRLHPSFRFTQLAFVIR